MVPVLEVDVLITGFFGVPGVGKTTIATMFAQRELKRIKKGKSKYKHVLTNFECDGCEKIKFSDIGVYDIQDSLIILDELTIDADNRDFKNFKKSSVEGFIYHRHYYCDIMYFTQDYNAVDKKIRNLTQDLYFLRRSLAWPFSLFTRYKRIFRCIDINDLTKEIITGYRFPNLWEALLSMFGMIRLGGICFLPRHFEHFDSYNQPLKLQKFRYQSWESMLKEVNSGT